MFAFFRHVLTSLIVLVTATSYDKLLLIIVTPDFIHQLQVGKTLQHVWCLQETSLRLGNFMVLFCLLYLEWWCFQMLLILRSLKLDLWTLNAIRKDIFMESGSLWVWSIRWWAGGSCIMLQSSDGGCLALFLFSYMVLNHQRDILLMHSKQQIAGTIWAVQHRADHSGASGAADWSYKRNLFWKSW